MIGKLKSISGDDRGVSPVIGVILMVAITVILAAVIGTFVLGLGDSLQQAPQATLNAEDASNDYASSSGDAFVISQDGGDGIAYSDIRIIVSNDSATYEFEGSSWTNGDLSVVNSSDSAPSGEFAVGNQITITDSNTNGTLSANSDYQIQLIHAPSESIILDQEVTLR